MPSESAMDRVSGERKCFYFQLLVIADRFVTRLRVQPKA